MSAERPSPPHSDPVSWHEDILKSFFTLRRTEFGPTKETIERRIYDPGLAKALTWTNPDHQTLFAPSLQVYNRQAIFHIIKQHLLFGPEESRYDTRFVFLDIASFQSMNIPDNRGVLGGDYYLKVVAGIFRQCVREHPKHADIFFGRYGGDEFLFSFGASLSTVEISDFLDGVARALTTQQAYYQVRGRVACGPIALKGRPEIITVPTEATAREVFVYYLQRNLLLNAEEIENAVADFQNNPEVSRATEFSSALPVQIEEARVNYPAYARLIDLAGQVDAAREGQVNTRRLLHYFQSIHSDPLFDFPVLPFGEFNERVATRPLSHLYAFDLKFIKEINDEFSLIRGDQAIVEFVEQILNLFAEADRDQISVGRRGGTLQIAVEAFSELDLTSVLNLQRFQKKPLFEYRSEEHRVQIPVGFAKTKLHRRRALLHSRRQEQGNYAANVRLIQQITGHNLQRSHDRFYRSLANIIERRPGLCARIYADYQILRLGQELPLSERGEWGLAELISIHLRGSKPLAGEGTLPDRYVRRLDTLLTFLEKKRLPPECLAALHGLHPDILTR